jgi:protein tyrosine/serine phosphatase
MVREFIDFAQVFNFRDCGGFETNDNHHIAHRKLYRSDNLAALTDADVTKYQELGIRTIIDLRPAPEIEDWGGPAPKWAAENWINSALRNPAWLDEDYSPEAGHVSYLVARYRELLAASGAELVATIRAIANPSAAPVVVHCLGGRDRTGIVIAFILDLLGVPDQDILSDYQMTEQAHARRQAWLIAADPDYINTDPDYVTKTPSDVIETVLDGVRAEYGSVLGYLKNSGFTDEDLAQLKRTYLES